MTASSATVQLVGTLELASKYRYGLTSRGVPMYLFRPYDNSRDDYIVGCSERDTTRNQLAIVEVPVTPETITSTPTASTLRTPRANLLRLLGPVGDPAAERAAILQHYCPVPARFPTDIPPEPDTRDDTDRIEISAATGWTTLHVDPPGCRDIDDAIAWFPTERLWAIVIADVAAAIPNTDHSLDVRARAIGATFYDLDGRVVRPMLPPAISEDSASLIPGQRRRGIAYIFPDSETTTTTTGVWKHCWITVAHSYTYESFVTSPHAWMARGQDPHDWIAAQMIRYNAAAATLLQTHTTGLLRVQAPRENAEVTPAEFPPALQHLLNERATYQPADATKIAEQGHTGLGLPAYTHASSPLRRYADLINQRAIKQILRGLSAPPTDPAVADHLNHRTTANRRWTRDLTFLTHVTPGKVHVVDVIPVSATHVWVPLWNRLLRLRHEPADPPTRIAIFCDPTKRNWTRRVLTAPAPATTTE